MSNFSQLCRLHQLFLEERIESCFNDPSRLVKLKKRQFSGCIDSKDGKSYMEKFLETPSPEHKMVYEASVAAPTLHLRSDNTNELGLRILDITTVSPTSKSPGRVSTCSSCLAQEEELKRPINGDVCEEIVKMTESTGDHEIETIPNLQVVLVENQIEYGEGKTESSIDGYRSDEVISEVDNYVDALATMESEMETDNEPRSKHVNLLKVGEQRSESDANDEHLETIAQLSDSQSLVNSSVSDDGNSSLKRERSSFPCSDTVSSLVDNIQYDSEGTSKALSTIPKLCMVDIENMPCNPDYISHSHERKADESGPDNTSVHEDKISKSEKVSGDSCFLDPITPQPRLDPDSLPPSSLLVEPKLYNKSSTNLVNFGSQISITETGLDCHRNVFLDVPSETVSGAEHTISSEVYHIRDREGVDVNATSENSLHLSNVLGQAVEIEAVEKVEGTLLQKEYQDDRTIDKQPLPEIESCPSFILPSETSLASTNNSSDDICNSIVLKGDDNIVAAEAKYEDLPLAVDFLLTQDLKDESIMATEVKYEELTLAADYSQKQDLDVVDDVLQVEDGLAETGVSYSEREANIVDITSIADDGKVTIFPHADNISDELQLSNPNDTVHEIHLNSPEFVTETVNPEGITVPSTAVSSDYELASPCDLDHEDSVQYSDVATEKVRADELVDSAHCSDVVTKKVPADEVVDSNVATEKFKADGVVGSTSIEANTATITEVTPKNLDHFSDEGNTSIDKLPTGTFQADGFAFDTDPTTVNDANEVVCASSKGLLSTSENMKSDLLENHTGFENPYPDQNGFKDTSDYSVEPVEVSCAPLDSKDELVFDHSDSGKIDGIDNLPVPTQTQCTSVIDDLSFNAKSLDLRNLESQSNSLHQGDLKEGIEFMSSPPLCLSSAIETSNEPSSELQAKHKEVELIQADDVSSSSRLEQCIKIRSPGQLDEEKVELVQSSDPVLQDQSSKCNASEETIQAGRSLSELSIQHPIGEFNMTGRALQPVLPSEETIKAGYSLSELTIQHPIGELNMTGRTMDKLQPVLPSYILLPEVPQVNLSEMPPLPPLPPMQWRLGKVQQAFPAPPGSEDPLQSILPRKAEEKGMCLESSNAEILQPEICFQDKKHTHVSGPMVHSTMQPPFSTQLPMISNENFQYSSATMDKQYNNPFLTLPPMPKENPEQDFLSPDGEKVRSDLNLPSLGPTIDVRNCKIDSGSSYGQSFQQPFSNSASEIGLKRDMSQHVSQDIEGEQRNSHVMMGPLSFMMNEQSQHDLPTTEQEVASSSNTSLLLSTSGVGLPNGNPPTSKLLRPRSPLIDAVAAHDKSKVR